MTTANLLEFASPVDENWQLDDLVKQVLSMRQNAFLKKQYGPFIILCGWYWRDRLGKPYVLPAQLDVVPETTLKGRILKIGGITDVICCERMNSYGITLIQVAFDQDEGYKFDNSLHFHGDGQ